MEKDKLSPKELNERFVDIWETDILERLKGGQITMEMDIQAIFHEILLTKYVGNEKWRCYHDIPLVHLDNNKHKGNEYDLALYHYPKGIDGNNKLEHYPAIVAEFKLWRDWKQMENDISKLDALQEQEKDCLIHSMSILGSKTDNNYNKLQDRLAELKSKGWEVKSTPLVNPGDIMELQTKFSQWKRYKGNPFAYDWYHKDKDGAIKKSHKKRKLIMLRLSK